MTWLKCLEPLKSSLRDGVLTATLNGIKLLRYLSSSKGLTALSIMALTPGDIASQVGETAKNIMGVPAGLVADQAAEYIKSGGPTPIIPNLGVAVARQACRRYVDNPGGVPGAVAGGFERVCRPYLDDIGYGSPPSIGRPFDGGQCQGALYRVDYEFKNGPNWTPAVFFLRGPLSVSRALEPADNSGNCPPGTSFTRVTMIGFQGERRTMSSGCDTGTRNISVSPFEGAPNNCGNAPPEVIGPGVPATPDPPGPQPYNPSPGIDVDIDVQIGPGGDITFNIGTGPITIDPFGDGGDGGSGGDNPGIDQPGTAPSSGLPPGDIGQPAEPVATPSGGTASGCAPPNSVLVGVKVNILEPLPPVSQYDEQVLRGVCYVYMGVAGNLALDPSGVALRNGQFCLAPVDNLTCWEVRANVNFILRVTPYYRALEPLEV